MTPGPSLLAGRYELGERLGVGGMGSVHRALDRVLGRDVAVKLLAEGLRTDERSRRRFTDEARAVARLQHPNVVQVFDAGIDGDVPFFVMELVEGRSLDQVLAAGPMDPDEVVATAVAVASGLAAAHDAGLVHRDVKPGNVLVTDDGDVKVTDFGIAAAIGADLTTVHGTLAYAAPEQARGAPADARSDIYALGCLVTVMATGQPPFPADTPAGQLAGHLESPVPSLRDRRPGLPAALDALAGRLLAKDPSDRPSSMHDVVARLRAVEAGDEPTRTMSAASGTAVLPDPGPTRVIDAPVDRSTEGATTAAVGAAGAATGSAAASSRSTPSRSPRLLLLGAAAVAVVLTGVLVARGGDPVDDVGSTASPSAAAESTPTAPASTPTAPASTAATSPTETTPPPTDPPAPDPPASVQDGVVAMRALLARGRDDGLVAREAEQKLDEQLGKVLEEQQKAGENEGEGGERKVAEELDKLREEVAKQVEEGRLDATLGASIDELAASTARLVPRGDEGDDEDEDDEDD